jgi:tungstate transport system substrate-binding protein
MFAAANNVARMALVVGLSVCFGGKSRAQKTEGQPAAMNVVRCAVIGGLNTIDFWPEIADRFERASGLKVEIVATGPKQIIAEAFQEGAADIIAMHACDTMVNLVADGYAENLEPWARNDFVLVGPSSDPANIHGEKDVTVALGRIIASRSKLLLHASHGASELLGDLLAAGQLELDAERTISLPGDKHRQMLKRAAAEQAYTLVGRIPFLSGKIDSGGLAIMVQGDARLRRPYLIAVAATGDPRRLESARRFAAFLREPATQAFIADFGRGRYDSEPLLFPVRITK